MNYSRIILSLRLWTIMGARKRAAYLKKKKVFRGMGNGVSIESRKVPLYPNLIRFHNNIVVASDVSFVTHDAIHSMLNRLPENKKYILENVGCIEIMDNVFIGAGSKILGGVRIGPNVIIGAGSVVNKDIPPNSVAVGVPAKVIGTFDALYAKRLAANPYPIELKPSNLVADAALADYLWQDFMQKRDSSQSE